MRKIILAIAALTAILAAARPQQATVDDELVRKARSWYPEYVTFLPSEKLDSVLDYAKTDIVPVIYKVNKFTIQPNRQLDSIVAVINRIEVDPRINLAYVWVGGSASPEGPEKLNKDLGMYRARALADYLRQNTKLTPWDMRVVNLEEDWSSVEQTLLGIDDFPHREKILYIIANEPNTAKRKKLIQDIDGGETWRRMIRDVFAPYRNSRMVIVCAAEDIDENRTEKLPREYEEVIETVTKEPVAEIADGCGLHAYVKTNLPAWLMLWINAAGEIDCAPHWSVTLPIYYSGFNYFKQNLKWRVFALQPEARYWPDRCNKGFFVGAHVGLAWYNYAFGGDYRYQDHNRSTPALGGGISVGYRFCVSKNRRWWMEATIGAGIYHMDYDLFVNKWNGLLVDRKKRTFYGIDNAALSISYQFDVKGGKKR